MESGEKHLEYPRDRILSSTDPALEPLKQKLIEIKAEEARHKAESDRLEAEYRALFLRWDSHQPGAEEFRRTQAKISQIHADQAQRDNAAAAALAKQHIAAQKAEEAARESRRREIEQITGRRY